MLLSRFENYVYLNYILFLETLSRVIFQNVRHTTILLMEQEWKRNISNKPKLRKYITLKENRAIPDYVSTSPSKPHRSIFPQFCCGI